MEIQHRLWREPLAALCLLFAFSNAAHAEPDRSRASSIPPDAVAYLEVRDLGRILRQQKWSLAEATSSAPFAELAKSKQFRQAQAIEQIVTAQLGVALPDLLEQLLGNRFEAALFHGQTEQQPDVVVVLQTDNAEFVQSLQQKIEPLLVLAEDDITISFHAGARTLALQERLHIAFRDDWLFVSTSGQRLHQTLDLSSGSDGQALSDNSQFREAMALLGEEHLAIGYLGLNSLRGAAKRLIPRKLDNALASLLFGGILEAAAHSPFVGATLDLAESELVLRSRIPCDINSLQESHRAFFPREHSSNSPAGWQPDGKIGSFSIRRDFATWYRNRDELLEAQVLPGFDKFESGLGNLLPGKDFGEDVLPLVGSQVTLLAAKQDFDHLDGAPGLKLPGFAAVVELRKPAEAADVFQLFFQTFTAILNIQAGQQGRQPWVMASEAYRNTQIAYGRYLEKPKGDRLPLVFNFLPSAAWIDDKMIISSSLGLCRDLIDQQRDPPTPDANVQADVQIEFAADALADILQLNEDFFFARSIQRGNTHEEAAAEFTPILALIRRLESLDIHSLSDAKAIHLSAKVKWK